MRKGRKEMWIREDRKKRANVLRSVVVEDEERKGKEREGRGRQGKTDSILTAYSGKMRTKCG